MCSRMCIGVYGSVLMQNYSMYVFKLCFQICYRFGVIEIVPKTHVLSELK